MAKPYKEGRGWCVRKRYKGHDLYFSGFPSKAAVERAGRERMQDIDRLGMPKGRGADGTTVAQAVQDYGLEHLPFLKGALQEATRMNRYLRAAGLATLEVTRPSTPDDADACGSGGAYFEVSLAPGSSERVIPNGLAEHRKAQLTQNARTEKCRAVLAGTAMSKVTREQLQALVNGMRRDRNAPATIALERAMLRALFNHAFSMWRWGSLMDNPATKLKMPAVKNERKRVMSLDEQTLLDAALAQCRNDLIAPVLTLLRETAMRASEPLAHARWRDVNWDRRVLTLSDGKDGRREVPLSPVALQVLRDLQPGAPEAPIVTISYDALKKGMERACQRAGIKDLHLHDLRRTGATRMALKTGNLFLVKALTGHKTDVMAQRYMQVGADDVVNIMYAPDAPDASNAPAQPALVEAPVPEASKTEAAEATVAAPAESADSAAQPSFTLAQMQAVAQLAAQAAIAGLKTAEQVEAPSPPLVPTLTLVPPPAPDTPAAAVSILRRAA